ncbi:winged helix-turn-helix transcriptional regulator [Candidatus Pacearchaeota archaeon]|nr:winged helix-turn-helix transcriptional regulator [Candidatus Pacearchaeota archaeon]
MVEYPSLVSFVMRAKNRLQILSALEKEAKYSGLLAKETRLYKSHISRAIKELESKELIVCKNPLDRSYKFYSLTSKGKKVLDEVKKITFKR